MPSGKPFELCVGPNLNGGTDWFVEKGDETVTEDAEDVAVTAEVAVVGAVGFTADCKPPTVGDAFSFTSFAKSNLKPPTELAVLLLLVAVFK